MNNEPNLHLSENEVNRYCLKQYQYQETEYSILSRCMEVTTSSTKNSQKKLSTGNRGSQGMNLALNSLVTNKT